MATCYTGSVVALTSVADGGQSSWFPSEIPAAELSALRSTGDHRCCYLCLHSPGARHEHTHMNAKPSIKKLEFCFLKPHKISWDNIKNPSCIQFWVATQTPGVITPASQWVLLCRGTLRCRYQCAKAEKCTSCPVKYPSTLIFMQNKT